ncbi:MAG: hypothetical protein EB069_10825 [Actinobacteria bacterium]|nr:hypothetical protein [Actinomycetota bacterium]
MQWLFPSPVLRTPLGLDDLRRQELKDKTLSIYGQFNPNRKPWSRSTRESLEGLDPAFADLFCQIKDTTSQAFGVEVISITGREVVQFKGDFIPPHVESSHLSAIYWVDGDAHPDHTHGEHDGALVLQSPIGPFGSKALPGEMRVCMVDPCPDLLLVFPSHLLHFGHVYLGDRPSVEIHMEMEVI